MIIHLVIWRVLKVDFSFNPTLSQADPACITVRLHGVDAINVITNGRVERDILREGKEIHLH